MKLNDFRLAIAHLIKGGLITPFGDGPWNVAQSTFNPASSEGNWNRYSWNPPSPFLERNQGVIYSHFKEYAGRVDPLASPKPTWAELTEALTEVTLAQAKSIRIQRVQLEETRRICEQYLEGERYPDQGATVQLELLYRARASAEELAIRDAERNRLHIVATTLVTRLKAATTIDDLIDPTADSLWTELF